MAKLDTDATLKRLRNRYRLVVMNDDTYEEKESLDSYLKEEDLVLKDLEEKREEVKEDVNEWKACFYGFN